MSPQAGTVLLKEIAPRLRVAIPKVVKTVGAEDAEELVQDAITVAAQMLDRVERAGKQVTPGNIAYYVILHMKSGRRSHSASRSDALACGTQLDGKSSLLSTEEEVGYDPELDEPITLEQVLEGHLEDPALAAGRNVDWELFLSIHDYRYGVIVKGIAEGKSLIATGKACGAGCSRIYQLRNKLADDLRGFMGLEAIADAAKIPSWRGMLLVDREKAACRAERRKP